MLVNLFNLLNPFTSSLLNPSKLFIPSTLNYSFYSMHSIHSYLNYIIYSIHFCLSSNTTVSPQTAHPYKLSYHFTSFNLHTKEKKPCAWILMDYKLPSHPNANTCGNNWYRMYIHLVSQQLFSTCALHCQLQH